jgi:hypothetical protein
MDAPTGRGIGRVGGMRPVSHGRSRLSLGFLPPPIDPCMRLGSSE